MSDVIAYAVVRFQNALAAAREEESGQTLVEYALIISLVSIGSIVALGLLSGKINGVFSTIRAHCRAPGSAPVADPPGVAGPVPAPRGTIVNGSPSAGTLVTGRAAVSTGDGKTWSVS